MAEEYPNLKRFVPGSEVRIKTVLDHKANIKHVNFVFRNRQDVTTTAVIPYDVKADAQKRGDTGYTRTRVETMWQVPSGQAPGPYLLESITTTTFEGDPIDATHDRGEGFGFFIEAEPEEAPHAQALELS